jgi:hypothetical protein
MEQQETKTKNKCYIYKNDLKFNDDFDMDVSEFNKEVGADIDVEQIYKNFKDKPKIELRLEDSRMENYNYLDLSNLGISNEFFNQLLTLKKITKILLRIEFLDLSNNQFMQMPDLKKFSNIKHPVADSLRVLYICHPRPLYSDCVCVES